MAKKEIQPTLYKDVEINCICWQKHVLSSSTVPWPIRVESCRDCHPAYNPDKKVEVVVKGRRQKYLEKLEKMKQMSSSSK